MKPVREHAGCRGGRSFETWRPALPCRTAQRHLFPDDAAGRAAAIDGRLRDLAHPACRLPTQTGFRLAAAA